MREMGVEPTESHPSQECRFTELRTLALITDIKLGIGV